MEDDSFLDPGHQLNFHSCHVHPVVVVSILDHFTRRNGDQQRVIGTLVGAERDGVLHISSCFPVPHDEREVVAVATDFHKSMFDLHHKAHPRDQIVGWYSTGLEVNENSALIHDFYWHEMNSCPIHLVVDTEFLGGTMTIKTLVSNSLQLSTSTISVGAHFIPIPHSIGYPQKNENGVSILLEAKNSQNGLLLSRGLDTLEVSLESLRSMLTQVHEYVNNVAEGKVEGDPKIGRFLANAVSSMPELDSEQFTQMLNGSIQDLLMIVYLGQLTRTQLKIAERLQMT